MNREEAIEMWVIPALKNTWNEKKCDEILKALEQEPCTVTEFADRCMECGKILGDMIKPCEDCVSRDAVLEALYAHEYKKDIRKDIEALPPVTPAEKVGRWISFGAQGEIDGQIVRAFTCSKCGAISIFRMASGNIVNGDLCPNCGSNMQEVDE